MIEGVVGNGYQGDIAIDDLSMTPGCIPANRKLLFHLKTCHIKTTFSKFGIFLRDIPFIT